GEGKASAETIFYDGGCGLCHTAVRFVLAEDHAGDTFRFAPLQGETFQAAVSPEEQAILPSSVVVRTAQGTLLIRARAVLYIMRRLGGLWRLLAAMAVFVPISFLDKLYDGVARIRHRLFQAPKTVCPILPVPLRQRFDA